MSEETMQGLIGFSKLNQIPLQLVAQAEGKQDC